MKTKKTKGLLVKMPLTLSPSCPLACPAIPDRVQSLWQSGATKAVVLQILTLFPAIAVWLACPL